MGRFSNQVLSEDDTWNSRYNIPEKDRYSELSTSWTLVSIIFNVKNYGIKLIYDEIDAAHRDMSLNDFTIKPSVILNGKRVFYKDLFETIPNFRKTVLLLFSTKNDFSVFHGCGFLVIGINRLCIDSKKVFLDKTKNT